jgi:hypothetical protein
VDHPASEMSVSSVCPLLNIYQSWETDSCDNSCQGPQKSGQ